MLLPRSFGLCALTIITTFVLACSGSSSPMETPDAAVGAADAAVVDAPPSGPSPTLAVGFEPATIAAGESTTLTATFTDFALVDPRTGPPVQPNEGHYHIYIGANPNYIALWEARNQFDTTAQDAAGTTTLRAVLVGSDHVEIQPVVEATTTLTITAP